MTRKKTPLLSALTLCVMFSSAHAWADGGMFPAPGFPSVVEIPAQRAFISFRDGMETLIVESGLSSESPNVAWVLPVPSVPDTIEKASPGGLKTLSFCLQPRIIHDLVTFAAISSALLFLVLFYLAIRLESPALTAAQAITAILFVVLLAGLLLPALGSARQASFSHTATGVAVEQEGVVGSYAVSVLRADAPGDLDKWLRDNRFAPLPKGAEPIVADYIERGWCFCVAKLLRTEGGTSTPHPLKVTFSTDRAVYPMRLTALAASTPRFEIFVAGKYEARCDRLDTEFVDLYNDERAAKNDGSSHFSGTTFGQDIGHESICPLLWDGCVLTKLSGKVSPARMTDDIVLDWQEPRPVRRTFFTHKGAFLAALGAFSSGLFLLTVTTLMLHHRRVEAPSGMRFYATHAFPRITLAILALSAMFYFLCPKLPVQTRSMYAVIKHRHNVHAVLSAVIPGGVDASNAEPDLRPAAVEQALSQIANPFWGGRLINDSSPGNYTLSVKDGQRVVYVYDRIGRKVEVWPPVNKPAR